MKKFVITFCIFGLSANTVFAECLDPIPGEFIVKFKSQSVEARSTARAYRTLHNVGMVSEHRFVGIDSGMHLTKLEAGKSIESIKQDASIEYVTPNCRVKAAAPVAGEIADIAGTGDNSYLSLAVTAPSSKSIMVVNPDLSVDQINTPDQMEDANISMETLPQKLMLIDFPGSDTGPDLVSFNATKLFAPPNTLVSSAGLSNFYNESGHISMNENVSLLDSGINSRGPLATGDIDGDGNTDFVL